MKDPLDCLPLKFYPTPSPALFVALILWLNEWSRHIWCIILYYGSTHIQPWYLSTTRNLLCVLCYKTPVYWSLTHNMVFSSTLIWYDTQTHKARTGSNRLKHPFKYILTPPVMCSQQLSYYIELISCSYQTITWQNSTMFLLFKIYWLLEATYLLIRFNHTKFFPWNTRNTERYCANKQNLNHHSLRKR